MNLSVGTNFDPLLVERLASFPQVRDLYGTMPYHVVGHGRPRSSVPQVTREQVAEHVALVHSKGLTFTYLFNGPSIGGRQFRPQEHREIRDHLEWVDAMGADAITVSIPSLVPLIRERHPRLAIKISHNNLVRCLPQALAFAEMGVDMITLHQTAVRDLPLVRQLASRVPVPFQIICTIDCMPGCPNSIGYHMSGTSTLSSTRLAPDRFNRHASAYCFSWCHLKKLEHPEEILKGGFVRPEDLAEYEAAGIHEFKLDTRVLTTDHLVDRVRAYAERHGSRDLRRLLSVFSLGNRTRGGGQMGGGDERSLRGADRGAAVDPPEVAAFFDLASRVDFATLMRLDSAALDGFLSRFESGLCDQGCADCDYCRVFASRAMAWNEPERARFASILRDYREWLLNR